MLAEAIVRVLVLLVVAFLFGWLVPVVRGVWLLLRRRPRPDDRAAGGWLLLIGLCWLVVAQVCADHLLQTRDKARLAQCQCNLKSIGIGLLQYAADHKGRMPPDLAAVRDRIGCDSSLQCGLADQLRRRGSRSSQYVYRRSVHPRPADPICWDPVPHLTERLLFMPRHPMRAVLFGDGRVKDVPEGEFRRLCPQ